MSDNHKPILLFDGVCNLCNGVVNFIIDHDPQSQVRLGSLQSDEGGRLMQEHGLNPEDLDTVVLIEDGRAYVRSEAVLRVAAHLDAYAWLRHFRILPRPIRDWGYRLVAHNRYRLFGKKDQCRLPTPELQARFLS